MTIRQFIQKDNVSMLWDVISDEDMFKYLSRDIQAKIYQLFLNNIQGFFDNEKIKTNSLVDINKKYILLILNHIRKTYPFQQNKITIHQEPLKESITYEEIQNDRRTKIDREFNRIQEEFEDYMTIKAPPAPEFADKETDSPIKEMDKILKDMQMKRNYEIEQINRNYNSTEQIDNWLKPQETSLKTEKFTHAEEPQQHSRFKFLNMDALEPIKDKKNVSFSNIEEIQTFNVEDEEDDNIFSKLKKLSNNKTDNVKMEYRESNIHGNNFINEEKEKEKDDRFSKLELEVKNIANKMDKILNLLYNK